jgi:hypothetical protein
MTLRTKAFALAAVALIASASTAAFAQTDAMKATP